MYKELVDKQNKLIELFSYNLTHPELLVKPYPFDELIEECNGLYKEYQEETLLEQTDEVEYLKKRNEELENELSIFTDEKFEYSTRKEFLDEGILQDWLMEDCKDDPDDELQFSKTNRELKLKIRSVIDDGYINITFTKEHGEQEGETNETF